MGNSRHSSEEQKSTITHLATGPTVNWWILSVSRGLGHRPEAGPLNWREGTEQKLESSSWDTWGCSGFDTKSSCHKQNKLVFIQKGKRQWQSSPHSDPPDVLDSAVLWISNFLYFGLTAMISKAGSPQPPSRLYHAVQLLSCDLFSKPNSSVFALLSRLEALMHIIPYVSWSQCWLSQRTCYLLNLLIILPWHPGLTLAAITTRTVFIFSSWKPIRRLVYFFLLNMLIMHQQNWWFCIHCIIPGNSTEVRCFTLLSELLMEQLFNSVSWTNAKQIKPRTQSLLKDYQSHKSLEFPKPTHMTAWQHSTDFLLHYNDDNR